MPPALRPRGPARFDPCARSRLGRYTAEHKRQFRTALRFGLACDPKRVGWEGGKAPYEVKGFGEGVPSHQRQAEE